MYPNLEAEMARRKITRKEMALFLGVTPTTLGSKLNGEAKLSLPECLKIKKFLNIQMDVEELFKPDEMHQIKSDKE